MKIHPAATRRTANGPGATGREGGKLRAAMHRRTACPQRRSLSYFCLAFAQANDAPDKARRNMPYNICFLQSQMDLQVAVFAAGDKTASNRLIGKSYYPDLQPGALMQAPPVPRKCPRGCRPPALQSRRDSTPARDSHRHKPPLDFPPSSARRDI